MEGIDSVAADAGRDGDADVLAVHIQGALVGAVSLPQVELEGGIEILPLKSAAAARTPASKRAEHRLEEIGKIVAFARGIRVLPETSLAGLRFTGLFERTFKLPDTESNAVPRYVL